MYKKTNVSVKLKNKPILIKETYYYYAKIQINMKVNKKHPNNIKFMIFTIEGGFDMYEVVLITRQALKESV